MTKKEYVEFTKLIKANNLLADDNIKAATNRLKSATNGLKAATDLSKIIKAFAKKVTPQKQPVNQKAIISSSVLLEIQSYDKHLN